MAESKLFESVALSDELVSELCRTYGIACLDWQLLKGGLINTSVRVDTTSNPYLLRIYPGERTLPEVEFEMSVLMRLSELHLPVQKPLLSLDGEAISQKDGRHFVFLEFIDGTVVDESNDKLAEQIGSFIARMNIGLQGFVPQGEKQAADIEFIDSEMHRLNDSLPEQDDIYDRWIALRDQLGSYEFEQGVVHADIHPGNVIASEDGDLKGVIDFDDCYCGSILFDLAIAAMSFSFESDCRPNWNRAAKVIHAHEGECGDVDHEVLYRSMIVNCFRFYVYTVPLTLQDGVSPIQNTFFRRARFLMDDQVYNAYSNHLEKDR